MNLSNLLKIKGSKSKRTRLGRGYSSGHGHTSGRGQKGQKARTGTRVPWYFEGGQLPLVKRLPHVGGFRNINRKEYFILKTSDINNLKLKQIDPSVLVEKKLIKKDQLVKVLYNAKLDSAVTLTGFKYSKKAIEAITSAGGKAN